MPRVAISSIGVLLVVLVGACDTTVPQLSIDVITDYAPERELARVEIERYADYAGTVLAESHAYDVRPGDDFLEGVRVAELELTGPGDALVAANLFGARGGRLEPTRFALLDIRSDSVRTIHLLRCRRTAACPDGDMLASECAGTVCVRPACAAETFEACGATACSSDAECPAGVTPCLVGACLAGICGIRLDDGACGPAEICRASGCVPAPAPGDAGAADAASG